MTQIKLGQVLKDLTTGFQGIAINRTEYLNGTIQYSLQPKAEEGKAYPETISLDEHLLEVVDEGLASKATEPTYTSPIKLGNKVKCLVTDMVGIATMKTHYMNGCAAYMVVSPIKKPAGELTHTNDWVDQCRLVIVDDGVAEKVKKPAMATNGYRPGGPPMRGVPRG